MLEPQFTIAKSVSKFKIVPVGFSSEKSPFSVCIDNHAAHVRIVGRAQYTHCRPLDQFLKQVQTEGVRSFHFDFAACTWVDSTFLGILVGLAVSLRRPAMEGKCVIEATSPHVRELIENIGVPGLFTFISESSSGVLQTEHLSGDDPMASRALICEAHENLRALSEENASKFEDIVAYIQHKRKA